MLYNIIVTDMRSNFRLGLTVSLIVLGLGTFLTIVPVFSEPGTLNSKSGPFGTILLVVGTITFGLCVGFKTRN